jgi:hypothetical protein
LSVVRMSQFIATILILNTIQNVDVIM